VTRSEVKGKEGRPTNLKKTTREEERKKDQKGKEKFQAVKKGKAFSGSTQDKGQPATQITFINVGDARKGKKGRKTQKLQKCAGGEAKTGVKKKNSGLVIRTGYRTRKG